MTLTSNTTPQDLPDSQPAIKTTRPAPRFLFVDGLRGVAATMVLLSHFTVAGAAPDDPFIRTFPKSVVQLLGNGSLGVEIFFVISGFVIAYSQRGSRVTPKYFLNFALRRSFRLDPPYWFTLFLEAALLLAASKAVHDRAHYVPTIGTFFAHMVYMQGLLRLPNILGVSWTLCLEIQFYLFFTLIRGLAQLVPLESKNVEGPIMSGLAVISLGIFCGWIPDPLPGLFIRYWFMFFLGVTVWWGMNNPRHAVYYFGLTALGCLALIFRYNTPITVTLVTACAIFTAAKAGKMGSWLSGPIFQFLGRISYSLYLIHPVIGTRIIEMGKRAIGARFGHPVDTKLLLLVIAFAVSAGCATLMQRFIEQPSIRLAKKIQKSDWQKPALNPS